MGRLVNENVSASVFADLEKIAEIPFLHEQKEQKFLITGGNGFIAYYVTLAILSANDKYHCGHSVTLLVRNENRARDRYHDMLDRDDVFLMEQDVCDVIPTEGKRFDYILHAASAADAKHFDEDPISVFNSNVIGMERVIDFIRAVSVKSAVFISSFTVYGSNVPAEISEDYVGTDDWKNNRSCYPLGKRCAEFLSIAAVQKYGCPIRIVRPGFVYGASSPGDNRVYAEIIRSVAEKTPVTLQSAGHLFRSMVYVTDVVRGILYAMFYGEDGQAYNIANEFASIREFAEAAGEGSDSKIYFANPDDEFVKLEGQQGGKMSTTKLESIGWKAEVSLAQGIHTAAEAYRVQYIVGAE